MSNAIQTRPVSPPTAESGGLKTDSTAASTSSNIYVEKFTFRSPITKRYVHGGVMSFLNLVREGYTWQAAGLVSGESTIPIMPARYAPELVVTVEGLSFTLQNVYYHGVNIEVSSRGEARVFVGILTGFAENILAAGDGS